MNVAIWIGAVAGFAGLLLLMTGLILFVLGSVRDTTTARARGADDDKKSAWELLFWLLKKVFAIIFGGDKYSPAQRGMAQGLILIVLGIVLLFGGLGTIAGAVAVDQATEEVEGTVQTAHFV
ncbi:hypothetical protein ABT237_15595 [Streptomyces sp. NPDC001581]|uniref:hypothetical protein n=1 Tax=Streptomyces sp. NPDC001581 TaxID=3154386 RepID=UPI003319BBAF